MVVLDTLGQSIVKTQQLLSVTAAKKSAQTLPKNKIVTSKSVLSGITKHSVNKTTGKRNSVNFYAQINHDDASDPAVT